MHKRSSWKSQFLQGYLAYIAFKFHLSLYYSKGLAEQSGILSVSLQPWLTNNLIFIKMLKSHVDFSIIFSQRKAKDTASQNIRKIPKHSSKFVICFALDFMVFKTPYQAVASFTHTHPPAYSLALILEIIWKMLASKANYIFGF